jgi:hypothetical protein
VNVILQTFQTVCLVQYDICIPFTVPVLTLGGQERLGTYES